MDGMAGAELSPPQHEADPQEVIQLLVAMSARLGQFFAACAAECGLSVAEGKLLMGLEADRPHSMRAIARSLGYDASNLTGVVDRLEDRGAVERRHGGPDRRIKTLALTAEGRELRSRLSGRLQSDAGPVARLSAAELAQLRTLLRRALQPAGEDIRAP